MKRKLISGFLAILAVVLIVPLITLKTKPEQIIFSSQEEEPPDPILLPGQIVAKKQAAVKFRTSGKLAWIGVEEGDSVKKGQTLASLDKRELEKLFAKEANDYLSERWDFEQTQDDYQETRDRHLVTDAIERILDKAQFELNNSVLDYEIANLAVEYATITSPIDGIVTTIDQPIAGVNIIATTDEIIIADPASVYFLAEADEEDVVNINLGQKGIILLDAYPTKQFEAKVKKIGFAPISGETSTVYAIDFNLPENTDLQFRLGMNGEVELE